MSLKSFDQLAGSLRQTLAALPDPRTGANTQYSMETIGMSAFSVFFTQSPSFLAYQKDMEKNKGQNNARSFFQIDQIPTDVHIRNTLDPVEPKELFGVYDQVYEALDRQGVLENMRSVHDTRLIALDGTWYFSSQSKNICCPNCSCLKHKNGETTHYHSAITPVVVAPGQPYAIPLRPEFIVPQDGQEKQDCEINAAKRWLENHASFYHTGKDTLLGDDLYSRQPFCRRALLYGFHFIFVCKPDSHTHLYKWVSDLEPGKDLHTLKMRVKNKKNQWEYHTYRYANDVPLVEGEGALKVNWCEATVTDKKGKVLYKNAFITDFKITDENVPGIVAAGRSRWKIENENNNTLKTKGYHLEHNFGHGKQHLSSLLATMNILAFLFHGFLMFCDEAYRLVRLNLPTRQTFFDDIRALTRYLWFPSWNALMDFMMRGLEIGPYAKEA
jgi:hypothetical protein